MNLQITDREKQALLAALESQRSKKQAVIESCGATAVAADRQEFRRPDNSYDILNTEHTLMHTISVMAKLTGNPIAYFMNPNPSQDPPLKTHDSPPAPRASSTGYEA